MMEEDDIATCFACTNKIKTVAFDHPLFKGKICFQCKKSLKESLYAVDDDGSCLFCAVCGDGGELVICENAECRRVYCTDCIIIHTDEGIFEKIKSSSNWRCFLCTEYSKISHGDIEAHQDWSLEIVKFYQADNVSLRTDLHYLTSEKKRRIRVLSLFDGIGTGKVALDELGLDVEIYYASEVDANARLVSNSHHGTKQVGNVIRLNTKRLKKICPIDLVLGGPPSNDLSIGNRNRKGFDGTGKLVWHFAAIVKDIETICEGKNHVFWLMENTAAMPKEYLQRINEKFQMEPAKMDAKHFQRRASNIWGNIPGMFTQPKCNQLVGKDKTELDNAIVKCGRMAIASHSRTLTRNINSLTITKSKRDKLPLQELEMLVGLPSHYTDVGLMTLKERRSLLEKSWSVPVIKHMLAPLKNYFKLKQT